VYATVHCQFFGQSPSSSGSLFFFFCAAHTVMQSGLVISAINLSRFLGIHAGFHVLASKIYMHTTALAFHFIYLHTIQR